MARQASGLRFAGASWMLRATMAPAPKSDSGIERADVIDLFAHNTRSDEVVLVMRESRPWDGSDLQLFQLQEKFNAYVSFLLDGELADAHPELAGKKARIELCCAEMPYGPALDLLNAIHDQLALQDIRVEVIAETAGDSCNCGCAN